MMDRSQSIAIYDRVGDLKMHPNCKHVKRFSAHRYDYRLRIGQYRVLFNYDGTVRIVSIEEVKKRDERTY